MLTSCCTKDNVFIRLFASQFEKKITLVLFMISMQLNLTRLVCIAAASKGEETDDEEQEIDSSIGETWFV